MQNPNYNYRDEMYYMERRLDDELEITEILSTVFKRKIVIFSAVTIFIILGLIFLIVREDIYTASTKLMVFRSNYSARNIDKNELTVNQQLVTTYSEMAKNRDISFRIIQKFNLDLTPRQMARKIEVAPIGDTEFIEIKYTDEEPRVAAVISNELARELVERVERVVGTQNLQIVETAESPLYPSNMPQKLVLSIFGIFGLLTGFFTVFLLETFHKTLRKPEDIEEFMGAPIIGSIPDYEDLEAWKYKRVKKQADKLANNK